MILTESDRANLWIGKNDAAKAVVVDPFSATTSGVFSSGFTLQNGDVHDFVRTSDIATGIDAGIAGLLHGVAVDVATGECTDASSGQSEAVRCGTATEGIQQMRCVDGDQRAFVLKAHAEGAIAVLHGFELRPGVELDAFIAEFLLDHLGG